VTELARIERRIARVEQLEDGVSWGCGIALAAIYFLWFWRHGYIATYSWIFPFGIGVAVPRIAFAFWGARLDKQRRMLTNPEEYAQLPEARVVRETAERTAEPIETRVPEAIEPAGEKPRFLG
jgi:hypothetical protein